MTEDEKGAARENYQGVPQDPTGVDRGAIDPNTGDQKMPAGQAGREGGSAGKFTRRSGAEEETGRTGTREAERPTRSR